MAPLDFAATTAGTVPADGLSWRARADAAAAEREACAAELSALAAQFPKTEFSKPTIATLGASKPTRASATPSATTTSSSSSGSPGSSAAGRAADAGAAAARAAWALESVTGSFRPVSPLRESSSTSSFDGEVIFDTSAAASPTVSPKHRKPWHAAPHWLRGGGGLAGLDLGYQDGRGVSPPASAWDSRPASPAGGRGLWADLARATLGLLGCRDDLPPPPTPPTPPPPRESSKPRINRALNLLGCDGPGH